MLDSPKCSLFQICYVFRIGNEVPVPAAPAAAWLVKVEEVEEEESARKTQSNERKSHHGRVPLTHHDREIESVAPPVHLTICQDVLHFV